MRPALRQPGFLIAVLGGLAVLAGCASQGDPRPPAKPETMTARIAKPDPAGGRPALSLARISTKSGEILILEPDGRITSMDLDSAEGRDAFAVSEAELAALNHNLTLDLSGAAGTAGRLSGPSAQEKALEEFAARTQPALPEWKEGAKAAPEDFIGARVSRLGGPEGAGDLVEVTANLREGVDADIAFSYATCALAGWARAEGAKYGRHIRTLQATRDGRLLIGAAFTISDGKPLGLRVMETNETLRECKARGIPAA